MSDNIITLDLPDISGSSLESAYNRRLEEGWKDEPVKSEISNWKKLVVSGGWTVIFGHPGRHPHFTDWLRTSAIVAVEGDLVITLNSVYRLVGPEVCDAD